MAIRILLDGVDVSAYRHAPSDLSWNDQLNGRGTASITFRSVVDGWRPEDGQELLIVEDEEAEVLTSDGAQILTSDGAVVMTGPRRLFGGILLEPEEWEEPGSEGFDVDGSPIPRALYFACQAAEFSAICDRRLVSRVYEQETVDEIVRDIVARDLNGELVSTAGVASGPVVEKAVFSDVTVATAFNELAELTGCGWRIDPDRVLQFRPRASLVSPVDLDGTTLLAGSVRVKSDRQKYRNYQVLRAGTDLTDERPETFVGDTSRRVFTCAFPLGAVPTIEESRNGEPWVEKTVGISGVDEGKDWYWNSGQAQVSQDDSGVVLVAPADRTDPTTGDRVRVTYRGQFPVKTQYQDIVEIAARKAIEGGSGIYANVEDRPQINSAQSAIDATVALIDRYGRVGTVVRGQTLVTSFEPGQVVNVNLPRQRIANVEMLIESISASYDPELDAVRLYVTAMSGDPFGGWQRYFRNLLEARKTMVVGREGEVLVLLRQLPDEGVVCVDTLSPVETAAPESRIGIMQIGVGEIGAA